MYICIETYLKYVEWQANVTKIGRQLPQIGYAYIKIYTSTLCWCGEVPLGGILIIILYIQTRLYLTSGVLKGRPI